MEAVLNKINVLIQIDYKYLKRADSIEEAEKCLQGRLKFVSKKFRDPGNTDEEIKKMEAKRKRSEKKELKTHKAQAQAANTAYLINAVAFQESSTHTENIITVGDEEELGEPKPKKIKDVHDKHKRKKKDKNERQSYESCNFGTHFQSMDTSVVKQTIDVQLISPDNPNERNELQRSNAIIIEPLVAVTTFQPSTAESEPVVSEEKNLSEEKIQHQQAESLSNSSEINSLVNQPSPLCELPSTSFGFSFDDFVDSILLDVEVGSNISGQSESTPVSTESANSSTSTDSDIVTLSEVHEKVVNSSLVNSHSTEQDTRCSERCQINPCFNESYQADPSPSGTNIIVLNFDELTAKYNDAVSEIMKLKSENETLKADFLKADRRNKLLQDYLVAADERVPEILFVEKDGGRLYRDGVFLTKNQCDVLDKAKTDNEYINNLLVCMFGRDVLKTHNLSGKRSKKAKGMNLPPAQALDKIRVTLIYEIMDARAVANKTKKLSKAEINAVITKKISNLTSYTRKS